MKVIYFTLLFLLICSCEKDRCYTIEGKEIINGEYFFLIDNNSSGNRNNYSSNNNNLYTGVPDPYGTGRVDKETYESTSIGEKYCQ